MLALHLSANLEYWFFKVNHGPFALIVDWIERRKTSEHILRASIHSPYRREVIFEKLGSFMPRDNFLSANKTLGHAGDLSWDLDIDLGSERFKPDLFPAGLLRMPDTLYQSAPLARFTGWIRHGSEEIILDHVAGAVIQYWGRQLSQEWWWLSAHQLNRGNLVVECSVFRTRLWGTPAQLPFAFLYLYQEGKRNLWIAPPSRARVEGTPDRFTIEFSPPGRKQIRLEAVGCEYSDFGERILSTLTGDLDIYEGNRLIAAAQGTAALERRAPQ